LNLKRIFEKNTYKYEEITVARELKLSMTEQAKRILVTLID
jgi:hypothetical protein